MTAFLLKVYDLIPAQKRQKLPRFLTYSILNTLLDFISITSLVPIIMLAVNRDKANKFAAEYFGLALDDKAIMILVPALMLIFVVKNFLQMQIIKRQSSFIYGISAELTSQLVSEFQHLDYQKAVSAEKSVLMRDMFQLPMSLSSSILLPLYILISESIILVTVIVVAFVLNPTITAAVGLTLGLLAFVLIRYRNKTTNHFNSSIVVRYQDSLKNLMNIFHGHTEIKSSNAESAFQDRFDRSNRAHYDELASLTTFKQSGGRYMEMFLVALLSAAVILLSTKGGSINDMILFSFFAAAAIKIIPSVNKIVSALTDIRVNRNVVSILSSYTRVAATKHPIESFKEKIALRDVSFSFNGKQIFKDVNLEIKKGDFVWLAGNSGTGKTTILQILSGMLAPGSGRITIDGTTTNFHTKHGFAMYVSQQPFLFQGTLLENITMLGEPADRLRIQNILEHLELANWAANLPNGIDSTLLLESKMLSGGQKQRIALARALYAKPQLLLLDEATNQLDEGLEHRIFGYLKSLANSGKLAIVAVSHSEKAGEFANRKVRLNNNMVGEYA